MRSMKFALLSVIAFPQTYAIAQEIDCSNPKNTFEFNYCANLAYQAADAKLNKAFAQAIKNLEETERIDPETAGMPAELRRAEIKWIAYRDADCNLVKRTWTNGSGATAAFLGCLTQKTNERIKFLRQNFAGIR